MTSMGYINRFIRRITVIYPLFLAVGSIVDILCEQPGQIIDYRYWRSNGHY